MEPGEKVEPIQLIPSTESILQKIAEEAKTKNERHGLGQSDGVFRIGDEIVKQEHFETEEEKFARIRAVSRRSYLRNRADQLLYLRQMELKDEKKLFGEKAGKLTQREIAEHERKAKELELLIEKMKTEMEVEEQTEIYHMPDTQKTTDLLRSREKLYDKATPARGRKHKWMLNLHRGRGAENVLYETVQMDRSDGRMDEKGEVTLEGRLAEEKYLYGGLSKEDLEERERLLKGQMERELEAQIEFISEELLEKQVVVERLYKKKVEKMRMRGRVCGEREREELRREAEAEAEEKMRKKKGIVVEGEEKKEGKGEEDGGGGGGGGKGEEESEFEKLQRVRRGLPVYSYREEFLSLLERNQVVVVVAQTGSGKTTQLPQYCYEAGYCEEGKKIGVTQPRRVAAMTVAGRVAEEVGSAVGGKVGYNIRFEKCTSPKTVIEYMTDGMLLREFQSQPDLEGYSVIMLDEAHERSLQTDILFSLLKVVCSSRKDLKLIVSSATLNAEKFSGFFDGAPILRIPGKMYPVDILYTKQPELDYVDAAVTTALQIHTTQGDGDILIFLTGQEEIEACVEQLTMRAKEYAKGMVMGSGAETRGDQGVISALGFDRRGVSELSVRERMKEMIILPIYSTMPSEQQQRIFEATPRNARKVIVATNIAETSLTIDGIVYVIDSGFHKIKTYNPKTGVEALVVVPISQSNAMQRCGRAGRVKPGKCFRLYTKYSYEKDLEEENVPEIRRCDLSHVVLMLMSMGILDLVQLEYLDPPPVESLRHALQRLYALGALNTEGKITKLGLRMAAFPLDPPLARALLGGEQYGVTNAVITICAMLYVENAVFWRPKVEKKKEGQTGEGEGEKGSGVPGHIQAMLDFTKRLHMVHHRSGDHLSLLNVFNQWEEDDYSAQWAGDHYVQYRSLVRARDVRDQLEELCDSNEVVRDKEKRNYEKEVENEEGILKALLCGFFGNIAKNTGVGGRKMEKEKKVGDGEGEEAGEKRSGGGEATYTTVEHPHTIYLHPTSFCYGNPPNWVMFHQSVITKREYMRQASEIKQEWLQEVAPHYFASKELKSDVPRGKMGRLRSLVDRREEEEGYRRQPGVSVSGSGSGRAGVFDEA